MTILKKILEEGKKIKNIVNKKSNTPNTEYNKSRYAFVELCIKHRLSYEFIGKLLGITKARIYQIQRYGLNGQVKPKQRKDILERDKHMCFICQKSAKNNIMNIHHISNPKDNSPENLISLCTECHVKMDFLKRKSERNLTKV